MWVLIWVGVVVLEWALSIFWLPAYFRFGLPIFFQSISGPTEPNWSHWLEALDKRTKYQHHQPLLYQPISATECAFREQLRAPTTGYLRIMRGLISYNSRVKSLTVTGWLNWSVIVPILYLLQSTFTSNPDWSLVLVLATVFVAVVIVCYVIQYRRFERVTLALRAFNP